MWRAACALISCGYTTLGRASSPDVISNNLNNMGFQEQRRDNVTCAIIRRSLLEPHVWLAWFVTVTAVADRIVAPVSERIKVTRYRFVV